MSTLSRNGHKRIKNIVKIFRNSQIFKNDLQCGIQRSRELKNKMKDDGCRSEGKEKAKQEDGPLKVLTASNDNDT